MSTTTDSQIATQKNEIEPSGIGAKSTMKRNKPNARRSAILYFLSFRRGETATWQAPELTTHIAVSQNLDTDATFVF